MTSLLDGRLGLQLPRVQSRPRGITGSTGPEAVELAAESGFLLDEWQEAWLYDGMAETADGSWAASEVAGIVSRQNGKNGVVEVRELAGLTLLDEWIIHTSHLFKTTLESFNKLWALIEANPDVLKLVVTRHASPAVGYNIVFRGGGRATFIARSRTSGRGLTGDVLVVDEAQDLTDESLGALLPTISARPGAQAWYLGSAPNLDSEVFHRVRTRGRRGEEGRLAYVEHSADPDADLDDRVAWAQANPALGIRITEEAIESERLAMSDEMFARERLSISPDLSDSSVFPGSAWADCCAPETIVKEAHVFAFDANPERSAAGIVAVGEGPTAEVIDYRPGVSWLIPRLKEIYGRYRKPLVVDGRGPAASLIEELRGADVELEVIEGKDLAPACGLFYDRIVERGAKIRTNPDLDRAVAAAVKRPVGDAWAWGRKSSTSDISLLVATTIGVATVVNRRAFALPEVIRL